MITATALQLPRAVAFDATNSEHRKAYVDFLNNGKWGVKFELEFPFTSLPSMIMYKLALLACAAEGVVDTTAIMAKSAYLPVEKAEAGNDTTIEKAA